MLGAGASAFDAAAVALDRSPVYGTVVGVALFAGMVLAGASGVGIPLICRRLGIDPAAAAGPLVATLNDVTGILIYFGLASALLRRFA